jgi:sugar lactone lactonase YvrE
MPSKKSSTLEVQTLLSRLGFGESPRWHEDRLWFSNWGRQEIVAVDLDGRSEVMVRVPTSLPFSIDWLPDGRLLVVSGPEGLLLRRENDGSLVTHADLRSICQHGCNKIVVDRRGNAYVNGGTFDPPGQKIASGVIVVVAPDGSAGQVADNIAFPNGMAVTAGQFNVDHRRVPRQETHGFDIAGDGNLSNRRVWADLGDGVPDGICIDAESAVWYGDVPNKRCVASAKVVKCCRRSISTAGASLACSEARTQERCSWWRLSGMICEDDGRPRKRSGA